MIEGVVFSLFGELERQTIVALIKLIGYFYGLVAFGYVIAYYRSYKFFKNSYHLYRFHFVVMIGWMAASYFTVTTQAIYPSMIVFPYAIWSMMIGIMGVKSLGAKIINHFKTFNADWKDRPPAYDRIVKEEGMPSIANAFFTAYSINDKILWLVSICFSGLAMALIAIL